MRPSLIKRLLLFCAVIAVALVLPAAAAADPRIEVIPSAHDFGEVDVGSSAIAALLVANFNGHDLIIDGVGFSDGSSADFALLTPIVLPHIVPPLGTLDLEIVYAPSAEGYAVAGLEVSSNDPAAPLVTVDLSGTGVAAAPLTIEDVLAFFDAGVEAGTIEGTGPTGQAKTSHQRVFRSTLLLAADAIDDGNMELACQMLARSYLRSDGQDGPKDFICGDDCPELNTMILQLGADMGCL